MYWSGCALCLLSSYSVPLEFFPGCTYRSLNAAMVIWPRLRGPYVHKVALGTSVDVQESVWLLLKIRLDEPVSEWGGLGTREVSVFLSEEPWEGNSWRYNVVLQWWQLSKKPWCLVVDWEVYMLESAKGEVCTSSWSVQACTSKCRQLGIPRSTGNYWAD